MLKTMVFGLLLAGVLAGHAQTVIRYNLLGYTPGSIKGVVLASKQPQFVLNHYAVLNASTGAVVYTVQKPNEVNYGSYGPFASTYRIYLGGLVQPGTYRLVVNDSIASGAITVGHQVYAGTPDFCLRYMRQQRSGFNPTMADSCHHHDGYTLGGPLPDSSIINAWGGWHDASDYLQYGTTSANATYQLLSAYRDFGGVFTDAHQANGLPGANGLPDVMDEARWGLDWLVKMHPQKNQLYHQIGDDRDHLSLRLPGLDDQYGFGFRRPVYAATGRPQGSAKYKNRSTGIANIAGKYAAAFALGSQMLQPQQGALALRLAERAANVYQMGLAQPGVCQTAPHRAPYFYEEDNWTDDMELAATQLYAITKKPQYKADALKFMQQEPVTPWLGADTARHYQWYPFINLGHQALANTHQGPPASNQALVYQKKGIVQVWAKAKQNAFLRGIPFVWCSNNLTVAFATQCLWYRQTSADTAFAALEQANIDWLLGCNPWGTSMVVGLPAQGTSPQYPHSAFTQLKGIPISGGLVDGPVYSSIYGSLIGIHLQRPDGYAPWQSNLAVYHDDFGDYSTNEPTMDGTASLVYLLAAKAHEAQQQQPAGNTVAYGAIVRADSSQKRLALVFAGHEFADGAADIAKILTKEKVKASAFLTGDFARRYPQAVRQLVAGGHYVGAHSDAHLLYAPWTNRDSLYITQAEFDADVQANYDALKPFGITPNRAPLFLPPYEWYNDSIAAWTKSLGLTLINNTPGTLSAADYTTPSMANYRSSDAIFSSIVTKARQTPSGLNGHVLLLHLGADAARTDKFYYLLPLLIQELRAMGYALVRIDELLGLKMPPPPPSIRLPLKPKSGLRPKSNQR
ncbi:MAG: cellulase [Bacteroidetes bacterium]|nr:MAG: cellulase [Bacteroidota bacterium]